MNEGVAEDVDLREEVRRLREEQARLEELIRKDGHDERPESSPSSAPTSGEQNASPQGGSKDQNDADKTQDEPEKKKGSFFRDHPVRLVILLIILIAAAIGGFLLWQYLSSYISTDDAQVDAHINAVTSRVEGTVVGVYVEDNQTVRAGQTLVDLDPRDYKIAVEQAQAQLRQAEAGVKAQIPNVPITQTSQQTNVTTSSADVTNAEAALSGARQSYESAVAQLRQAEANAAQASADEERYRILVAKDEVSKEQYDAKLAAAKAQRAIVDAQSAGAQAARDMIAQREAALAQAHQRLAEARQNAPHAVAIQEAGVTTRQADVQRAQASLDQALLNLTYCKIGSPITGIVGRRSVELGQHVSPGQQLMGITNVEDLWVTANFKETQLRNVRPQQNVRIHVDAINADFDGYVESIPGATGAKYSLLPPENATGNYVKVVQRLPVRIRFKSQQSGLERLRPGMSVEPKVWIR